MFLDFHGEYTEGFTVMVTGCYISQKKLKDTKLYKGNQYISKYAGK